MTTTLNWIDGIPIEDGRYLLMIKNSAYSAGGYVIDAFFLDGAISILPGGDALKGSQRIMRYAVWPQYQES